MDIGVIKGKGKGKSGSPQGCRCCGSTPNVKASCPHEGSIAISDQGRGKEKGKQYTKKGKGVAAITDYPQAPHQNLQAAVMSAGLNPLDARHR
eukprot:4573892-Amphidinium_carterae.2